MKINKYIRILLIFLLLLTTFIGLALLVAGSHGNISIKNKDSAIIIYGGIVFVLTAIINGISLRQKYSNAIGFTSLFLNLISGFFLTYHLISNIKFSIDGGHFPIFFLIVIGIEILMIGKIIALEIKQMNKTGYNTV